MTRFWSPMAALLFLASVSPSAEVLWQSGDAPGTVLVSFKRPLTLSDLTAETRRLGLSPKSDANALKKALMAAVGGHRDLELPLTGLQRIRLPVADAATVNAALAHYRASALVEAAEPDHPIEAAALVVNDSLFASGHQWYLSFTAWTLAAKNFNDGSIVLQDRITVAVIDTGVDSHNDLGPQLLTGASFVPGALTAADDNGHGTFCAGLIAASTGNGTLGIAGAFFDSSKVRILPVKVLDNCGSGSTSNLAAGIIYAAQSGARVINMSIQADAGSTAMENAVNEARNLGVLVVAASGNKNSSTSYPAAYSQVMSVGALHSSGTRASYSNYGKLELSAPGGDLAVSTPNCQTEAAANANNCCVKEIWSLANGQVACNSDPFCSVNHSYEAGAGTSFAAPLVAAAAALLFSQDPNRRVEDVQRILLQSAAPTAYGSGYHPETGWGKLDFAAALGYQSDSYQAGELKVYNWPNPFNPERDRVTTLTFYLSEARTSTLRLLDAGGDLVRQWELGPGQARGGMNLVAWDGRNGQGQMVANGAYTLVLDSGGRRVSNVVAVLH